VALGISASGDQCLWGIVPLGDQCLWGSVPLGDSASGRSVPLGISASGDQCLWGIVPLIYQCPWGICATGGLVPVGNSAIRIYAARGWRIPALLHYRLVFCSSRSQTDASCACCHTGVLVLTGAFWRWGVIVALGGCDASRERCPCVQWPVDPLGDLHSGVNAVSRQSEGGVGVSSWP
jgi:hypothetical protein